MTDTKTLTTTNGPHSIVHKGTLLTMTEVFCSVQIQGIHNWPECAFDEVAYLRDPHRHVFHVKAHKFVTHADRDIEFIMLKQRVISYLVDKYGQTDNKFVCEFGAMSCEMIAHELCMEFGLHKCEVSEDGENGAVVHVEIAH